MNINHEQEAQRLAMECVNSYAAGTISLQEVIVEKLNLPQLLADSARVKELEWQNKVLRTENEKFTYYFNMMDDTEAQKEIGKLRQELKLARKCVEALRRVKISGLYTEESKQVLTAYDDFKRKEQK